MILLIYFMIDGKLTIGTAILIMTLSIIGIYLFYLGNSKQNTDNNNIKGLIGPICK
jgi:Ca2+/Na+ antiporter